MSAESDNIIIRNASIKDAALLANLGKQAFDEAFGSLMPEADIAAYLTNTFTQEQLSTELRDANTTFLIASIQNKPAGYAKLQAGQAPDCITAEPAIEIVRLYALKQSWGHGVGAALMQQCLEVARQQGYATIWLSSWKLNDRANAFYHKWEFRVVGEQPFVVGSDIQEDFVMARLL